MQQIVTGDETWIHNYEPESKRQSMQCKHPSCPVAKKFKMQPSAGKMMLIACGTIKGLFSKAIRNVDQLSQVQCIVTFFRELKPAICSKRRGKLSKEILLFHYNTRPHTTAHTLDTLKQLKWEAMEHPAYSANLAPSDFHLFGPLKNARRFSCDDVKAAVHQRLRAQPKTYFADGIKKLVGRWEKCIAKLGDYIEK